ncbi:MAG: M48 family metallopeptidase [Gammaproteobacteria bacterium]|nr:M48 family metallopeptidase [Gammaproteobacteria bacterium]
MRKPDKAPDSSIIGVALKYPSRISSMLLMALALCLPFSTTHSRQEDIRLPDIGDPANQVLSPAEERQLGSDILGQIRSSLNVVDDPELNSYIHSLGIRLVTAGVDSDLDFTFLYIGDPSLNAFAAPGGIVAINTGLIRATESESELAGVLAHEIAHVKQRHLARAYANASQIGIATALGVLASIAAGIYSPELGGAALHSTIAASTQARLSFSRANEQEADRIGMGLLANAGFDPMGMPNFFERMHRHNQFNAGPILEFLSTHPVTLSRISDTRGRAAQYSGSFIKDSKRFEYAKARVSALTAKPSSIIDHYDATKRQGKSLSATDKYAYAIALSRATKPHQAIKVLHQIKDSEPESLAIEMALAQTFLAADKPGKALKALEKLNAIYPKQDAIVYYLAKTLIDMRRPAEALERLDQLNLGPHKNPRFNALRAQAAAEAMRPWLSHEALADYYIAYGQYGSAMEQFELALRENEIDSIAQARIRSKRKELRKLNKKRR